MAIETFTTPENRWLSNMWRLDNWVTTSLGIDVPTTEHGYVAEKFADPEVHRYITGLKRGIDAKEKGNELLQQGAELSEGFHERKIEIMTGFIRQKFGRNFDLAAKLIDTGNEELVEGNYWGDRFWGVDPIGSHDGANNLGLILMKVRAELLTT